MCDSWQFIVQLSRRLCGQIQKLTTEKAHTGAVSKILKLKLLAKFLGLVIFSPNWDLEPSNNSKTQNEALLLTTKNSIANVNATTPILPIYDLIAESYINNHLTMTISWVVEYLRMSKWDFVSKFSRYYQRCFSLLFTLHRKSSKLKFDGPGFNSNLMFVSFEIESLLCDVMTFKERDKLFFVDLSALEPPPPSSPPPNTPSLDDTLLFCAKSFLLSSSPFFTDIENVLMEIKRNESSSNLSRRRRMTSKKMRPLSISFENARKDSNTSLSSMGNGFSSFSNINNLDESFSSNVSSTPLKMSDTPQSASNEIKLIEGSASKTFGSPSPRSRPFSPVLARSLTPTKIQKSLVDAFFHQHPQLQNIAELAIEIIVKEVSTTICDHYLKLRVGEEANRMGEGVDTINPR